MKLLLSVVTSVASSSPATPSTREHVSVLVGKVQDLFNQKYSKHNFKYV